MIEKMIATSFLVLFIYASMEKKMLFSKVRVWFASLTDFWKKPFFDCYICMCGGWGSLIYWTLFGDNFRQDWKEWLITICGAAGFNTIVFLLSVRDFDTDSQ